MLRKQTLSAALALMLGVVAHAETDPVAQSFERLLNHTPVTSSPAAPAHFGPDPLMAAMVEPLRSSRFVSTAAVDLRVGGFDRMLAHTPTTTSPALPANFGVDPLIAAMVVPLRLWEARSQAPQYAHATTTR